MAIQIKKKNVGADQVDGSKILLEQNQSLRAKNSSGVEQDLLKFGASNEVLANGAEIAYKSVTDAIQADLDIAEGNISTLQSDVVALDVRVDSAEATIITHTSQISTLQSDLSLETSNRIAADNDLDMRLDSAEATIITHTGQISTIQSDISLETSNRIAADNDLDMRLDSAEATIVTHTGQISTLQSDLSLETSNRIAADSDLDMRLDSAEATIVTHTGQISTLQSDLSLETSNRIAADSDLDMRLDSAEATIVTHTGQISTLQSDLSAETSARIAADSDLQDQIDALGSGSLTAIQAEIDATQTGAGLNTAGGYVVDMGGNYISTATSLHSADQALDVAIAGVQTSLTSEISDRIADVDAEESARISADVVLQGEIDAVEGRMTTAEGEIDALQAEDIALDGRLDTIESTLPFKADLVSGLVPANQLPSYVDDVLEYADLASFPATGEAGKIYVAVDTSKVYRWSGTVYIQITSGAVDTVNGQNGVVVLDAGDIQMVSEAVSVESKLVSLQGEIDAEESARASADSALQGEIDAEEIARAAADTTLQNNINAETTARTNADNALDTRVDALEGVLWKKEKFALADNQTSVTLAFAPIAGSVSAFVDALAIHESLDAGATDDYSISGTSMTFLNALVTLGQSQLGNGDTVYVRYQYNS
jgi:polyhydroxyalkanoate synthesis regulator phasin